MERPKSAFGSRTKTAKNGETKPVDPHVQVPRTGRVKYQKNHEQIDFFDQGEKIILENAPDKGVSDREISSVKQKFATQAYLPSSTQEHQQQSQFLCDDIINERGVHDLFSDILFYDIGEDDGILSPRPPSLSGSAGSGNNSARCSPNLDTQNLNLYQNAIRAKETEARENLEGISILADSLSYTPAEKAQLRLLRRSAEAEMRAIKRQQSIEQDFPTAYPDLQRSSGLKVLKKIIERQRRIDGDGEAGHPGSTSLSWSSVGNPLSQPKLAPFTSPKKTALQPLTSASASAPTSSTTISLSSSSNNFSNHQSEADQQDFLNKLKKKPPAKLKPMT